MGGNKTNSGQNAYQVTEALSLAALGSWRLTRGRNGLCFIPGNSFLKMTGLDRADIPENFESFVEHYISGYNIELFCSTLTSLFESPESENEFSIDHDLELNGCHIRFHSFGTTHSDLGGSIVIDGFSQKLTTDLLSPHHGYSRIILDSIPLPCVAFDEQHRMIDCNLAASRLFEMPDKQSYQANFLRMMPTLQPNGRESTELAHEHIERAFKYGRVEFEWIYQSHLNNFIPYKVTLAKIPSGANFIVVGYINDIRDFKDAQAERYVERQLLRRILDSAPICFFITVDGIIRFLTNFTKNLTGQKEGDFISNIFASKSVFDGFNDEFNSGSLLDWRQVDIVDFEGQIHTMLMNAFKSDYYGENGMMAWFVDITELRKRTLELKEARDTAEYSAKAKSEFLANMSHEIRTPMNAILGLIHLVMQTDLSNLQCEYLQKTESSAKTLLRIINDILDISKIEAGKLEIEAEPFQLDEVIQQVIDVISAQAIEKNLELLVNVPPNTPAQLVGDQIRLAQILSNLLANAIKFTDKGEVSLTVETVCETDKQATLKFLVRDTGIGLSPEQAENLFKAFSQAELSTSRRYGGTGLGLTISKSLVAMMGGEIWCESQLGEGSTFGFTGVFGFHDIACRYVNKRNDFSSLKALVVDDNVVALGIISEFLKTLGFIVSSVDSGLKALELICRQREKSDRFDLVMIDWKMPGMDGIETSSRINGLVLPEELPVIIMTTAYSRDEVLEQARRVGINHVMTKPMSPSTLFNMLVDIFGRGLPDNNRPSKLKSAHEMTVIKEFAGARILLAEDNEVNQLVASRILKNAGLEVDIASSGCQAVDMVTKANYDLVLMDIQMPEMDGIEATHAIRLMPGFADLPIVAMTARAMSGDRELSLKAGMNAHINKPINIKELFSTLALWMKKRNGRPVKPLYKNR